MRFVPRIFLGALLALGVITSAAAATPDGKTPSTAMPLSSMASTSITGSQAGSFAYLTVNYPGNNSVGTLTINFSPQDSSLANSVGVDVWQDGNMIATANGIGSTPGSNSVTFSSASASPVLVQLYNYNDGVAMSFQASLSGVTPEPAAGPAPAPAPAQLAPPGATSGDGTTASSAIALTKPETAVLPGNAAGVEQYYSVTYPGDASTRTVALSFVPTGADAANAIFVNVYQAGNLIASGQGTSATVPGNLTVNYASTSASPILIQVANYNPDTTISYTISD